MSYKDVVFKFYFLEKHKNKYFFISILFLAGCSSYKVIERSEFYPHPSDACIPVSPIHLPRTLDIKKESIPKNVEKEPEMHHMKHSTNEKGTGGDGNA